MHFPESQALMYFFWKLICAYVWKSTSAFKLMGYCPLKDSLRINQLSGLCHSDTVSADLWNTIIQKEEEKIPARVVFVCNGSLALASTEESILASVGSLYFNWKAFHEIAKGSIDSQFWCKLLIFQTICIQSNIIRWKHFNCNWRRQLVQNHAKESEFHIIISRVFDNIVKDLPLIFVVM